MIWALGRNVGLGAIGAPADFGTLLDQPFESRFQIPMIRAAQIPFFERKYFTPTKDMSRSLAPVPSIHRVPTAFEASVIFQVLPMLSEPDRSKR